MLWYLYGPFGKWSYKYDTNNFQESFGIRTKGDLKIFMWKSWKFSNATKRIHFKNIFSELATLASVSYTYTQSNAHTSSANSSIVQWFICPPIEYTSIAVWTVFFFFLLMLLLLLLLSLLQLLLWRCAQLRLTKMKLAFIFVCHAA